MVPPESDRTDCFSTWVASFMSSQEAESPSWRPGPAWATQGLNNGIIIIIVNATMLETIIIAIAAT